MILQKIKYSENRKPVICAINTISNGGEYTLCGNSAIDAGSSEYDDWKIIGNYFNGNLKQVTCPKCQSIINFIKSLE